MSKKQKKELKNNNDGQEILDVPQYNILKKKTIKDLIAPAGIDASNIDHLEIISNTTRYARSFFVSSLPRMCTFPELLEIYTYLET